jgi:PTS system nitrogen regulatory IIA component
MDLTVKDAARLLSTSEQTIYRWIHDGTLPSYRINEKYRLNRVELLEWATASNIRISPEIFDGEPPPLPGLLLTDALRLGGVVHDLPGADKASALKAVCAALPLPEGVNRDEVYGVLLAREALGSTAIGNGIAIPHPRSPLIFNVKNPTVTLAFLRQPVDFGALDRRPVEFLFAIISTTIRVHLRLLSHLMYTLQEPTFVQLLRQRETAERIIGQLTQIETGLTGSAGNGQ